MYIVNRYWNSGEIPYEISLHNVSRPFSSLALLTDYEAYFAQGHKETSPM
jgi:hypothetical protein